MINTTVAITLMIMCLTTGFGFGTLAGYHLLKYELHDYYEYLEYLVHRQNPIPNSDSKIEIDSDNVYHVFKEVR